MSDLVRSNSRPTQVNNPVVTVRFGPPAAQQAPAFLSVTDSNRWCLRGCRCGTLSGMDAAPEPTWTYLRRVPHRYACKGPRQTRALAWKRLGVGHRVIGVRSRSAARRRIRCRDTPSIHPCRLGGDIHVATWSRPRTRHHAPSVATADRQAMPSGTRASARSRAGHSRKTAGIERPYSCRPGSAEINRVTSSSAAGRCMPPGATR